MIITKEIFKTVIEHYILPLIPIASIGYIVDADMVDTEATLNEHESIQVIRLHEIDYVVFNPKQVSAKFYYFSKLSFRFDSVSTAKMVLDDIIVSLNNYRISSHRKDICFYVDSLCRTSVEIGICGKLGGQKNGVLLAQVIYELNRWSHRTYEGKKIS